MSAVPAVREQTAVVVSDASALMKIIEKAAMDPQFNVEKLEKLLAVRERWEADAARKSFNEAFANFKAEAVEIVKNRTVTDGPLKNKKYAELFSVVNAVTPALSRHGLSASWKLTKDEKDWIEVACTLRHVQGHSETVSIAGPPDAGGAKNAIQARASTITYLERYTLKAICGLAEQGEDTDGNGNGKRLADDVRAFHIRAIDTSPDDKTLLKLYGEAHRAAIDAEDMGSLRLFTEHKDARKKSFGAKS